jgi:uncharacterized protein with HEPN domain
MSKKDRTVLLKDILESIQKIKKYTEGMNFELFIQDDKTIDACVRNFEIIGEVSSKIEEDFKLTHP